MTDKKEKILTAALELFAQDGYNATSTSKIAKEAGVSEGLIFRHFQNKKGLLDALVADAERKLGELLSTIIFEPSPQQVIRKSIEMPFLVPEEEQDFWKLQFKIKWEQEYNNPDKLKPLIDKLSWAFSQLGYEKPEQEAILLNQILDAMSISVLRDGATLDEPYKEFLLQKYNV